MSYFRRGRGLSGVADIGLSQGTTVTVAPTSRTSGASDYSLLTQATQVKTPPVIVDCQRGHYPDPTSGQCIAFSTEGALPGQSSSPGPGNYIPPVTAPPAAKPTPWLLYGGLALAGILAWKHFGQKGPTP